MLKAFTFLSIFVIAVVVESRPSSHADFACAGCGPEENISRTKRDSVDVLNSISGLVGNILHENWKGIERVRALKKQTKNIYIGNGRNNNNKVYINPNRDDYDY